MNPVLNQPSSASDAGNKSAAKQAYVTLLSSDSYLAPVLVLHHSLQRVGSSRKLVVLVTPNLAPATLDSLARMKVETRLIQPIINPAKRQHVRNIWRRIKGSYAKINLYATVYTKLRIWELTEFSKIVFLDSDMMVLGNCDELFSRPTWSAVNAGGGIKQYQHWQGMNSGMMVIEPSAEIFADMMRQADHLTSSDWGDQGFLQVYFPQWPSDASLHLPHTFNMPIEFIDQYRIERGYHLGEPGLDPATAIKILHFWRTYRPWQVPLRDLNLELAATKPLHWRAFWLWIEAYAEISRQFPGVAASAVR